jgi:hypothetical protein
MNNSDTIELKVGQIWKSYTGVIPDRLNEEIEILQIKDFEVIYKYLIDGVESLRYLTTFDHYFEYVRS